MFIDESPTRDVENFWEFTQLKRSAVQQVERTFIRKRPKAQIAADEQQQQQQHNYDTPDEAENVTVSDCSDRPQSQKAARSSTITRPLTQLHLDLGQANFACQTCKVCGMTFAPGEKKDEIMHAAYHASLVQGVRFTGWQSERVVQQDGLKGRILLVLPTDSAAHLKKVNELANLLEDQLGLVTGWLMSTPCKVYLYVTASKRVVGCAMVQAISKAYHAVPAVDAAASPAASEHGPPSTPEAGAQQAEQLSTGPAASPQALLDRTHKRCSRSYRQTKLFVKENRSCAASEATTSSSSQADVAGATGAVVDAKAGHLGCTGVSHESPAQTASPSGRQRVGHGVAQNRAGQPSGAAEHQRRKVGSGLKSRERDVLLRVDESRPKEAACGVRVIWVSMEARMQGIATKLLDVARSTFVAGYIMPREELAFSQPTEHGRRFAASYTGCASFLVYK